MAKEWTRTIPLISAEGEMRITTIEGYGQRTDIVMVFANRILSGNVSGFMFGCRIPWRRALEWAHTLVVGPDSVKAQLEDGRASVLGQRYGDINMRLNPMAEIVLYLTPEDCETIAHVVTEACIAGTRKKIPQPKVWGT